eukprot:221509-Chlamydomonas_euryale.AAC.5
MAATMRGVSRHAATTIVATMLPRSAPCRPPPMLAAGACSMVRGTAVPASLALLATAPGMRARATAAAVSAPMACGCGACTADCEARRRCVALGGT